MDNAYEDCKNKLIGILENSELLPLVKKGVSEIDNAITFEVKAKAPEYFYQGRYSKLVDRVLCEFQREEKIFENKENKFKLKDRYTFDSVRYFVAETLN